MGVKIGTFTLAIPGHVVRRTIEGGTEIEVTGEQAAYIVSALGEVAHLFPDPPNPVTALTAPQTVTNKTTADA